jgi:hypothetical protein
MLRKGSAGSNTAADHIAIVDASIAALPPAWRRNLMVTVDGAGFSHKLVVSQTFPLQEGRRAFESGARSRPPGETVLIVR